MEDKLNDNRLSQDKLIIVMPDGRLVTLTDEQIKNMFSNCLTVNNLDKMFESIKN